MINWQYYPKSDKVPSHLLKVISVFESHKDIIESPINKLVSNDVLAILADDLENVDFKVERSKRREDKIRIPVLFGRNGEIERSFEADAYNEETKTVLEVEAGRAVDNYQFLKDLFQACVMHDTEYLAIAVKNIYKVSQADFNKVTSFFDTLYASQRLKLPLKGILIIGY
ncbi:hypothetical protein ACLZHR_09565 [Priestia aryabhattai]|uniref:hypothetical protein n=1 Tax=Priestia aryabhattai TaxID=412384 RepID=UPI003A80B7B3